MTTFTRSAIMLLAGSAALLALPGCSKRQAYEGMQASQKQTCERAPTRAELERCLQQQSLGFEDYEARRERDAEAAQRAEALERRER